MRISLETGFDGIFFSDAESAELLANAAGYRQAEILPRRFGAPLTALWEITSQCNLGCPHCYNDGPRLGPDLEWDEMKRLAEEMVRLKLFSICLTGGEPTLHPQFADLLNLLNDGGIVLGLVTNGWVMTPQLAKVMAKRLSSIQLSLDGPSAEIHDRERGRAGSFERVVRTVKTLQEAGAGANLHVAFAATRHNIDHAEAVLELCEELGIVSARIQPLAVLGRAERVEDLEPTEEQVQNLKGLATSATGRFGKLLVQWGDAFTHIRIGLELGLAFGIRVSSDGHFGITPYYPIYFGNCRDHSLAQAWNGGLGDGWRHPEVRALLGQVGGSLLLRALPRLAEPLYIAPQPCRSEVVV